MWKPKFARHSWVVKVADIVVTSIEQIWVVDEQFENDEHVICRRWRNDSSIEKKVLNEKDLRSITLNEFIRVLTTYKK